MSDDAESGKWLKVKARMPNNQKVMGLSDAAFRLHISVQCWCCDEVNDGRFKANVPAGMPMAPRGKKLTDAIKEIVDAGLWHPTEDGYEVNDFLKYNMSRARWEALKAAGAEGGRRSGETRRREAKPEAPASAPARPKPQAPPQHDHDHEERSEKPPPKDLTGSARQPAPRAAADLNPGIRAFVDALTEAWHAVALGGALDALLGHVAALQAKEALTDAQLAATGRWLGRWLSEPDPAGRARSLAAASPAALERAWEDSKAEERSQVQATARRLEREAVLRASVVPRRTTPAPLSPAETLKAIGGAVAAVDRA